MTPEVRRLWLDQEILTDIFGFLPTRITDYIYNMTRAVFYNVIEGLNTKLVTLNSNSNDPTEALKEFEKDTEIALDEMFKTLQQYIHNVVWKVSDRLDIKLDYLKDIDLNLTEEHEKALDGALSKLRTDIINQKKLQHFLLTSLEKLENESSAIEKSSKLLSFLSEKAKMHNVKDIELSMMQVKTNLAALNDSVTIAIKETSDEIEAMEPENRSKYLRKVISEQLDDMN